MEWEERHKRRSVGSETRAGLAPIVITVAKQTNFCSWLSSNPAEPFCLVGSQLYLKLEIRKKKEPISRDIILANYTN